MDTQNFLATDTVNPLDMLPLTSTLPQQDTFICPQDVTLPPQDDFSPSSPSPDFDFASQDNNSTEDSSNSKKKRKSWGQVLPEPTTNLPPRKRAKTEAEKEQRKYERVQRNRQAAHNSRMRKQQEMDNLSKENKALEVRNRQLCAHIARLEHQLRAATGQEPQPPPSPTDSGWSQSAPSLCEDAPSPSNSTSTSPDQAPTPPEIKIEPDFASELKKSDDSHSAEMCSQQWTSDFSLDQGRPISLTA